MGLSNRCQTPLEVFDDEQERAWMEEGLNAAEKRRWHYRVKRCWSQRFDEQRNASCCTCESWKRHSRAGDGGACGEERQSKGETKEDAGCVFHTLREEFRDREGWA